MEFAIVDIETTGGSASVSAITEIAICIHNGKEVIDTYQSLVNPGMAIPFHITTLTGITDVMVRNAPKFSSIAEKIHALLRGRVFVAHNVNFDYSFVNKQLLDSGITWQSKKLCTVRLSRKVFPGLKSYSLATICGYHGIEIKDRHRAMGDTEATAKLFSLILQNDTENEVAKFLKVSSKENVLPPNLPKAQFDALSSKTGVYYFMDSKGKVIYVGKALDIKKRVSSHFTNNSTAAQKQNFMREVFHIRCTECANEAAALDLETLEIKKLWPKYNHSQKRNENVFAVVPYFDQTGFMRLTLQKVKRADKSIMSVSNLLEGYDLLRAIGSTHELCLRLSGIPKSKEHCADTNCICNQVSDTEIELYNLKVKAALESLVFEEIEHAA